MKFVSGMKFSLFSFIFCLTFILTSCTTVQQNEEGVMIHRLEQDTSKAYQYFRGRHFTFFDINTEYVCIPMYQQKGQVDELEVKTSDRASFKLDNIVYIYQPQRGHGLNIIKQYRQFSGPQFLDHVEENVFNVTIKALLRDVTLKFTSDSILSHTNLYVEELRQGLNKEFEKRGFTFMNVTMNIHEPESIKAILAAKSKAIQEAEAANAEAQQAQSRKIVIEAEQSSRIAKAKADLEVARLESQARSVEAQTYTPQYLDYLRITYWGEAGCPAQTVFYNGTNQVHLAPK